MVAIDVGASGLSAEEMSRNVLYGLEGTNFNRWMDKWNIIVCDDGQAGLNWEHSMLDGHTMMEYYAEVGKEYDSGAPVEPDEATCVVTPVPFEVSDEETLGSIATAIDSATTKTTSLGQECLEFKGFGGNFIKGSKCSPDGFVQAAMMIAYYQVKQKIPVPYESVLAKAYKHGRVTVARNMSELIANNLKAWEGMTSAEEKVEAYRATIADISRICAAAAKAQDVDRPMLAYRRIAKDEGLETPSIVDDAAWTRFGEIDLCTSHCGRHPIRFFGFEPPSADGYGVGYNVDKNSIQFSITHFDKTEVRCVALRCATLLCATPRCSALLVRRLGAICATGLHRPTAEPPLTHHSPTRPTSPTSQQCKKFADSLEATLTSVQGIFEEVAAKAAGAAEE